jgi:hypothetical protein
MRNHEAFSEYNRFPDLARFPGLALAVVWVAGRSTQASSEMKSITHVGNCTCGAVKLEATGSPEVMGYCHCGTCRSWSAAPVTAFSMWKADTVKVTSGAEHIRTFKKTERSERQFCNLCGGHLMLGIPSVGLVDIFPPMLPTLEFNPLFHVNYAETVMPIRDGLPKLRDFPVEAGGSGELIAE